MFEPTNIGPPLISVCIPTYNRAGVLENLLRSLVAVKRAHGAEVEIWISDNNSDDNTQAVIEEWRMPLSLKVITQRSNIGGSLNVIEVTKCATGRWVELIGDDDVVDAAGFDALIELLRASPPETWVLVGIEDAQGQKTLLGETHGGEWTLSAFRKTLFETGVYPYGFIGMHVIPSQWLSVYHNLSVEAAQSWAHLALFLRFLNGNGVVMVLPRAVVRQAGGGRVLFWKADDWARVNLKKVNVIAALRAETRSTVWFSNLLLLRELYSARSFREIVLWKALEAADFDGSAVREYLSRYRHFGCFAVLLPFHFLLLVFLRTVPAAGLQFLLRRFVRADIVSDYVSRKAAMGRFDGIGRGL